MRVIGLTGSIGMGKSTAAGQLRRLGIPVHDADAAVHRLLGPGGQAVPLVAEAFPGSLNNGAIDRQALGAQVFSDPSALKRLEAILHPLVRAEERRFLAEMKRRGQDLVVLDVPLLFETGGQNRCDGVIVVSAPAFLQKQRVMARPGMTQEKFRAILAKQMPDAEKRRRADVVIPTGRGRAASLQRLKAAVTMLRDPGLRDPPTRQKKP